MLLPTLLVAVAVVLCGVMLLVLALCAAAARGDEALTAPPDDAWYAAG